MLHRLSKPKKSSSNENGTSEAKIERKDEHGNYNPGAHVWARYSGDGSYRDCEVIDRKIDKETNKCTKYYLHYVEFNRRMDTWVDADQVSDSNPDNPAAELSVSCTSSNCGY